VLSSLMGLGSFYVQDPSVKTLGYSQLRDVSLQRFDDSTRPCPVRSSGEDGLPSWRGYDAASRRGERFNPPLPQKGSVVASTLTPA